MRKPNLKPQQADRVPILGQRLHRVLWHGQQWAVTVFGIEARDGTYAIKRDRLHEDWIVHMAEKGWVDQHEFAEALSVARRRFKPQRRKRLKWST